MGDKSEQNADLLTKHAFENDVDTFVRETLQNANDAGINDSEEPVEVHYRFTRLEGSALRQYLETLQFNPDDGRGLFEHLHAASGDEDDRQLERYLEHLQEEGEMLVLSVEDRNTEGLPGSETEDGTNYTALVRDMGRSNKEQTEGGSHGVGKTVFWAFSGLSTVLFSSVPHEQETDGEPPRFVGRTLLPDHRDNGGQLFSGNGWFGAVDPDDPDGRSVSLWDGDGEASALARRLRAHRGTNGAGGPVPGTTATVLGFRDPTNEVGADDTERLPEKFRRTVAKYFWPAIERGDLVVKITGPDADEPNEVEPEQVDEVEPFVRCYRDRFDTVEELGERGDVVAGEIEIEDFPDRANDLEDADETVDSATAAVFARRPGPGSDGERTNEVAVFRGAGMVVSYVDGSTPAAYGNDFHGLLMAGEARGWGTDEGVTDADTDLEELLRTSEPAAHDRWKGYKNTRLESEYARGAKTTVKRLTGDDLSGELRRIVSSGEPEDGEGIDALDEASPTMDTPGRRSGKGRRPTVESPDALDVNLNFDFDRGRWHFDGEVGPTDEEGTSRWEATLEIKTEGEDGNDTGQIEITDIHEFSPGIYDVSDGIADLESDGRGASADVTGESEYIGTFDPYSGRLGRTQIVVEGGVEEVDDS